MPVKYSCPTCGRRFAEWGAEKHGFKCPGDEWCPADRPDGIELVRLGMKDDAKPAKKPTLKRPTKRVAAAVTSSIDDDELLVPDIEVVEVDADIDDDDVDDVEEEEIAVEVTTGTAAVVVTDADEDLDSAVVDSDVLDGDDAGGDVDDALEDAEDIVDEEWKP